MDEQQNRPELPPGDQPDEQPTREQPPAPRRLLRSRDDRVIAGVCAGLGRYFDVDPVLFRIAAVALTFFGGAGALLYLAAVLLVPTDGEPQGQRNLPQRGLALTGIVLLVVAGGSILSHGPFHFWLAWPVGLLLVVGLGIWWLISAERSERDAATNAGQRLLRGLLVLIASAILAVGGAWLAGTGGATVAAVVIIAAGAALAVAAFSGRRALADPPGAGARAAGGSRLRGGHRPPRRRRGPRVRPGLGRPGAGQLPRRRRPPGGGSAPGEPAAGRPAAEAEGRRGPGGPDRARQRLRGDAGEGRDRRGARLRGRTRRRGRGLERRAAPRRPATHAWCWTPTSGWARS